MKVRTLEQELNDVRANGAGSGGVGGGSPQTEGFLPLKNQMDTFADTALPVRPRHWKIQIGCESTPLEDPDWL